MKKWERTALWNKIMRQSYASAEGLISVAPCINIVCAKSVQSCPQLFRVVHKGDFPRVIIFPPDRSTSWFSFYHRGFGLNTTCRRNRVISAHPMFPVAVINTCRTADNIPRVTRIKFAKNVPSFDVVDTSLTLDSNKTCQVSTDVRPFVSHAYFIKMELLQLSLLHLRFLHFDKKVK